MKTLIFRQDGRVRVLADSAMGRNRQPWFVPEFGSGWRWHVAPAVRISRLGKGIRPEFADRYAGERTLVWLPEADGNPAAELMDGAAIAGDWLPIGDGGITAAEREAIATAARYATLKQGDIIVIDTEPVDAVPLHLNDKIHVEFEGQTVIEFNIK